MGQDALLAFVLACSFGATTPAMGAAPARLGEWTRIGEGPQGLVVFYARVPHRPATTVRRTIQLLYDYSTTQEDPDTLLRHQSAVVSATVDCRANGISMGDMAKYKDRMGRGGKVEQTRSADRSFRPALPDTVDWKVVRFACAKR